MLKKKKLKLILCGLLVSIVTCVIVQLYSTRYVKMPNTWDPAKRIELEEEEVNLIDLININKDMFAIWSIGAKNENKFSCSRITDGIVVDTFRFASGNEIRVFDTVAYCDNIYVLASTDKPDNACNLFSIFAENIKRVSLEKILFSSHPFSEPQKLIVTSKKKNILIKTYKKTEGKPEKDWRLIELSATASDTECVYKYTESNATGTLYPLPPLVDGNNEIHMFWLMEKHESESVSVAINYVCLKEGRQIASSEVSFFENIIDFSPNKFTATLDDTGRPHVFWVNNNKSSRVQVYHTALNESQWLIPEEIFVFDKGYPGYFKTDVFMNSTIDFNGNIYIIITIPKGSQSDTEEAKIVYLRFDGTKCLEYYEFTGPEMRNGKIFVISDSIYIFWEGTETQFFHGTLPESLYYTKQKANGYSRTHR